MKTVTPTPAFSPKDFNYFPYFIPLFIDLAFQRRRESAALTDAQGRKLGDVTTRSGFGGKEGREGRGMLLLFLRREGAAGGGE